MILGRDANAIIFDKKHEPLALFALLTDFNTRGRFAADIFGCVVEQVLQELYQTLTISLDGWQVRLNLNRDSTRFKLPVDNFQCFAYKVIKKNFLRRVDDAPDAREFKQFLEQRLECAGCLSARGLCCQKLCPLLDIPKSR